MITTLIVCLSLLLIAIQIVDLKHDFAKKFVGIHVIGTNLRVKFLI
jgi:hypothetical protein